MIGLNDTLSFILFFCYLPTWNKNEKGFDLEILCY